jgi:3-mercaptopyruvate sulfurtransferase SseA
LKISNKRRHTMKKLFVLLTISVLFAFGYVYWEVTPVRAEEKSVVNKVDTIKAGKEEGTIDKEFFKKIVAEKPANVSIVDVRTPFEYQAGHFDGAIHIYINDLFDKGCDTTLARLPKEGYVVFVCATGARAGEMYFGIQDDCKYKDSKRLFFLDADVAYTPNGAVVQ